MIILCHYEGNYEWMDGPGRICLESIKKHNPKARLVVFTDKAPPNLPGEVVSCDQYAQLSKEVHTVYKPMGPNPGEWEWRCLNRWFLYAIFCTERHIGQIYSQDLDVLCFCDVEKENKKWELGADISCCHVLNDSACYTMGQCYIRDTRWLLEFTYWTGWLFQNPESKDWFKIYEQGKGIVNDMTLWTQFIQSKGIPCNDLDEIRQGSGWDANLALWKPDWHHNDEGKVITFEGGKPYGNRHGRRVRLNNLHCWGPWKHRVEELWLSSLAS